MKTRAAVAFEKAKPLTIATLDLEGPKAGEVLVEIKATGICHTDDFTISGADPEGLFPAIMGHEGAGIVRELGEGVRWDARRDELLRVDILAGRIYRDKIIDDGGLLPVETYHVAGTVAAIAPIQGDEGWLLAAARGFSYLRPDGTVRPVAEVAPEGTRMNDAACDPQGRFWAGTLAHDQRAGGGSLYRLDNTGQTELIMSGLTISNGLGWSPDGRTMYLVDTAPGVIHWKRRTSTLGAA